ncbi:MAG: NAD(P)H-hydrate epimerase [Calditrichaeota bacterium]|nr:MAG: NAD(P)H-hydrate epimerase [Calditrichota bacterium]
MQERNALFTSLPYPIVSVNQFPVLTVDEMREVDRLMIEEIGISLEQMMENAGHHLAYFARQAFGPDARVCILVGKGNNGGGGLVAARHLANWGHEVHLILATPGHYFREIALHQLRIVNNMQIPILHGWDREKQSTILQKMKHASVILDALIGYSLVGKPQDVYAELIGHANASGTPIISLDTPSGLDISTGQVFDPAIKAMATLTLAAPKNGLLSRQASPFTGDIFVADISVPDVIWPELKYSTKHLFRLSPILGLKI